MNNKQISEIIKNRRKELGITQLHLAELANFNINTIHKIECGLANPSLDVLMKIAKIMGMEIKLEVKKQC